MPDASKLLPSQPTLDVLSLDREAIRQFCFDACGGDHAVILDLVEMYLASVDSLVAQMDQALYADDHQVLRRAAHTFKSSSRMFGAESISQMCAQVEKMALRQELAGANELVAEIADQSRQIRPLLYAELRGFRVA